MLSLVNPKSKIRNPKLFYQFSFFVKKPSCHFICKPGKEFVDEYSSLSRKCHYYSSFFLFNGPQNNSGTFFRRHHFALVHRTFSLCFTLFVQCVISYI